MEDKTITCKDCGKEFIFTVGEQEFFKEKGFENDPVRCPDCRKARKAEKLSNRR
ncbi:MULTISPECIES: zinc-ribbon domain-containing protein [Clostridium]|uniref:Zinc-ribbon domain-containing protein n=1 Tax=Clostridium cibarium TaxID=2762247 RepID=A0ABR8PPY4_9CLOT|nr:MULTISPECIES: zinc-ribbon domain-containing protein [Clostridium]MBD7910230.1 zinc-ribbon domain-containing protein [Clostridium cibarium]